MTVEMNPGRKVACILCQRSEETKVTGALSTKDDITAHQNCLFDDLFGFSVEDVMKEVKRGNKLFCNKCRRKGATVGCEVKRCKKSYHYPCAIQEGAKVVEDVDEGHYQVYCLKHEQERHSSPNEINASSSKKARKAASSKDDCPACKNTEGSILLEKLDNSLMRSYCANHAPSTSRGKSGGSSVYSSASDSSSGTKLPSYKRQQSFDNQLDFSLSKRRCQGWKRRISDDSTNSEFNEPGKEPMDMFAPLDSDLEENANSVPKGQFIRQHSESCAGPALGSARADESRNKDEDETLILSDSESESLLLPVEVCMFDSTHSRVSPHSQPVDVPTAGFVSDGPSKEQGCDKSPESVDHSDKRKSGPPKDPKSPLPLLTTPVRAPLPSRASPQSSSSSSSAAPPTSAAGPPACATQLLDSTSFWKWCNTARCTEAIFTGFINEMTSISRRIQSDQASQDDRDVALKVMKASGKLEELIAKQHAELQRKQEELQQAAAALDEVASALRKPHQS